MRALLCRQFGPPSSLVLEEVADPVPGEKDVVIRVRAAGVNFPDGLIIQGKYQFKPELPFSPGSEFAGVIEKVGTKVHHFEPGMSVIGFAPYGGMAEQVKVDARSVVPMADDDYVTAAAFVMAYATSYHALKDRAALQPGETVLVLGASGGVGLAAVELAKVMGARVIACASTDEKLKVCREHGADEVISYDREDLKERVKALTGGKGADVIYDPVGGLYSEPALRSIAWRGRHLVIGFANGEIPKLPLNLPLLKGASLVGVFWGDYARREPNALFEDLQTLFGWLAEKKLKPRVERTYPLAQGGEAIAALHERRVSGKLVVTP